MEEHFLEPIKKIYHIYASSRQKNLGCFSHTASRILHTIELLHNDLNHNNLNPNPKGTYPTGTLMAYWFRCREVFQGVKDKFYKNGVLFFHRPNASHSVAYFLHYFEQRLGLEYSKFQRVETDNQCLCIHPNPFWFETSIHKSFFSMLLRASLAYKSKKRTPLAVLMACKEVRDTKYAATRFLNGYTELKWDAFTPKMKTSVGVDEYGKRYCAQWFGWVKLFKQTPKKRIDRILVV